LVYGAKQNVAQKICPKRLYPLLRRSISFSGWIHESFLSFDGKLESPQSIPLPANATVSKPYSTWEQNAQVGETFEILDQKSGWYWCKSEKGELGWLPTEILI
jgi:hypothetical protein